MNQSHGARPNDSSKNKLSDAGSRRLRPLRFLNNWIRATFSPGNIPTLRKLTTVGAIASLLLLVTSCLRGMPFPQIVAEPWFVTYYTRNSAIRYCGLIVFIAALIAMCWAWVRLLQRCRLGEVTKSTVWKIWFLWSIPMVLSVPLFSGDVFVYYVDGEAYLRGFSIYEHGVSAMGPTPMVHMVHPLWQDTQTMYGPLFMRLATILAWLADAHLLVGVVIFKLITYIFVVLIGVSVARLARFFKRNEAEVLALCITSPLLLTHFVSGAHNDAIMLGLLMAGLACGVTFVKWPMRVVGIALCAFGAAIKIPALAGSVIIGWIWLADVQLMRKRQVTWLIRLIGGAVGAVLGLVFLELATLISGLGWGWLNATDVPGLAHPLLSPPNALSYSVGAVFGVQPMVNDYTRAISTVVSLLLAVFFVVRIGANATAQQCVRGLGWALLALAWLGPSVWAWYLTWGLVVVATTGAGRLRRMAIGVSVATMFTILPNSASLFDVGPRWVSIVWSYILCAIFIWGTLHCCSLSGITWQSPINAIFNFGRRVRRPLRRSRPQRENFSSL